MIKRDSMGQPCIGLMTLALASLLVLVGVQPASARAQAPYTALDSANRPTKTPEFMVQDARDLARRDSSARRVRVFAEHLGRMYLDIPEYHDEQPFKLASSNAYGPMAYVYGSPFLDEFSAIAQIDAHGPFGVLVAVMWVEAPSGTTLEAPYTKLNLSPGMNCVYLAHSGSAIGSGWRGFILPGSETQGCTRPTAATPTLQARRLVAGGMTAPGDYPGVARFDEASNGDPLIGVRCLIGWCQIGPPGFAVKSPSHTGILPPSRQAVVRGWHDDQVLSARNPATGRLEPRLRATVTPVPGVHEKSINEFTMKWVHVATIWLGGNPAGTKYATDWGMKQGRNKLELSYAHGQWEARVIPPNATVPPKRFIVSQHKHYDVAVPGTARFRWRVADEGVWVPCDQGCCRVDAVQ